VVRVTGAGVSPSLSDSSLLLSESESESSCLPAGTWAAADSVFVWDAGGARFWGDSLVEDEAALT
jgi:hypothetical protein